MLRVPAVVDRVIRKLLQKDPDDRYQTPIELANDLQTIVTQIANGTLAREALDDDATEMATPLPPPDAPPKLAPASATLLRMPLVRPQAGFSRPQTIDVTGKLLFAAWRCWKADFVSAFVATVVVALMWR